MIDGLINVDLSMGEYKNGGLKLALNLINPMFVQVEYSACSPNEREIKTLLQGAEVLSQEKYSSAESVLGIRFASFPYSRQIVHTLVESELGDSMKIYGLIKERNKTWIPEDQFSTKCFCINFLDTFSEECRYGALRKHHRPLEEQITSSVQKAIAYAEGILNQPIKNMILITDNVPKKYTVPTILILTYAIRKLDEIQFLSVNGPISVQIATELILGLVQSGVSSSNISLTLVS